MTKVGFPKLTIRDVPLEGQTVLVRVDYNLPFNSKGKISDDSRIKASLPTLEYLLARHCKIVIMSHLGRPEGRDKSFSLEPIAERLRELTGRKVEFVDDCVGDKVTQAVKKTSRDVLVLLENTRFYKEDEANDPDFAKKIATSTGARYFVQDCFGVAHRAHASIEAITQYIPSVAGFLLEREYEVIANAMQNPKRPLVAVLGGAKISDKIQVIERFVDVADKIIIGGAMANTFLAYKGFEMGASVKEDDQTKVLDRIYQAAHKKLDGSIDEFIVLPTDVAVATEISPKNKRRVVKLGAIKKDELALDIGDESIERLVEEIKGAQTVIWNGTLGYAEFPEFAHASARLALALATQTKTASIIGGGDTADFVLKWSGGEGSGFTHISTGGGASLELMSGAKLPGIESLLDARK
jgi:phosphoglycerate kinase